VEKDILMVYEGKNVYEGLSLGIWKVIWVVRKVKKLFLGKAIFRIIWVACWVKMAILG
jgi:hypothetical protein